MIKIRNRPVTEPGVLLVLRSAIGEGEVGAVKMAAEVVVRLFTISHSIHRLRRSHTGRPKPNCLNAPPIPTGCPPGTRGFATLYDKYASMTNILKRHTSGRTCCGGRSQIGGRFKCLRRQHEN